MNPTPPDGDPARWRDLPAPAPTPAARGPVARLGHASPAFLAAGPDAKGLLHAFERRWPLAIFGGLTAGALAAMLVFLVMPPARYTVKAMIHVASAPARIIFQTSESVPDYRSYQRTQSILAKSHKVLTAALRSPEVAGLRAIPADGDPASWLENELKVDFPGGGEIMTITMTAADAREAAVLVNATSEAYLKQIVEEERRDRVARYDSLSSLFNRLQDELREKRKTYRVSVEDVGVTDKLSVASRQQAATQNLNQLQAELAQLQAEIRKLQRQSKLAAARRDAPADQPEAVDQASAEDAVAHDPKVAELRANSAKLRGDVERSQKLYRDPGDPATTKARERLAANDRALHARIDQVRDLAGRARTRETRDRAEFEQAEADQTLAVLTDQEAQLRDQVVRLGNELKSGNVKTVDMNWLDDEIALASQSARTVGSEVEALKVELSARPRIRMFERAETPVPTDATRRYKISGGAGMAGLALFAGAVIFLEARVRRVGSPDEVAYGLGIRLIGSIPARPGRRQIAKAGEAWQRMLIESVDAARTLILHASLHEPLKVIMIASAVKGEGKTTLSCLLAASLQRAGRRTLLIDGDLRCPTIHRLMDITPGAGLCEVLRGEAEFDGAIIPATDSGVDFLPAGRIDGDALRGLADGRLAGLIAALRGHYDQVIIDSAPMLYVPDGLMVAQQADAVVMAVLRGVSQAPKVYQTHERLADLGVRVLGAVVGGTRGEESRGYAYQYARGGLGGGHGAA